MMKPQTIREIIQLLMRVSITGAEAPRFMEILRELHEAEQFAVEQRKEPKS